MSEREEAAKFLTKLTDRFLYQLSHDKVPGGRHGRLLNDLGIVYDVFGDGKKFRVGILGASLISKEIERRRSRMSKEARRTANIITDEEKRRRKIERDVRIVQRRIELERQEEVRTRMSDEERWAESYRTGRPIYDRLNDHSLNPVVDGMKRLSEVFMGQAARGLSHTKCVTCKCEIDYKMLRVFDRRKKYECVICGSMIRPKKVPKVSGRNNNRPRTEQERNMGQLATIVLGESGFCAIVCTDCRDHCSSCWTDGTYKYLIRKYGVDLRDS
jgi:hypothetical protein